MFNLDEQVLLAFRDELRKEAGLAQRLAPGLKNVGSLGGVGALSGALAGAGIGGYKQFRAAREEGAGVGQAAMGGLGGAMQGASKGALTGGLLGAGIGAVSQKDLSGLAQHSGLVGVGSRFGQRQVHSLTGMLSPAGLEQVRGGAYDARKAFRGAIKAHGETQNPGATWTALRKAKGVLRAREGVTGIRPGPGAPDPMDLTSVPGVLRSVGAHGPGKVMAAGLREQLSGTSPAMGALMLGAPAVGLARAATSKDEFDAQGRGRGERVGEDLGRTVGGITGGAMPFMGGAVVGGALGRAGKYVGRGVDILRNKAAPPPGRLRAKPSRGLTPKTLEPAEGQSMPSERITSPAAAGQQPDIGL